MEKRKTKLIHTIWFQSILIFISLFVILLLVRAPIYRNTFLIIVGIVIFLNILRKHYYKPKERYSLKINTHMFEDKIESKLEENRERKIKKTISSKKRPIKQKPSKKIPNNKKKVSKNKKTSLKRKTTKKPTPKKKITKSKSKK